MTLITDDRLAIIIPTKDRPDDLRALLESMLDQSVRPAQVIIVDSGDIVFKAPPGSFDSLNLILVSIKPPSLPAQRNAGLRMLSSGIEAVAFFDDDILLLPGAIEFSMKRLFSDEAVGGVSMNNISHPGGRTPLLEKMFMVGSDSVGIVLPSGFQSKICSLDKDAHTQWLLGGATFWRRKIFESNIFDEWFHGYAHCEDLDFSYSVSKKYDLVALHTAKFIHNTKPIEAVSEYAMGKMQIVNRVYFVRKHKEFSVLLCYWACLGLLLKNLFLGVVCFKPRYISRAFGVFSGVIAALLNLDSKVIRQIKK